MKKFYFVFLSLLGLTVSSCRFLQKKEEEPKVQEEFVSASAIELNTTQVEIAAGESFKLEAKVLPENATNKHVKWSVNDQGKIEFFGSTGIIEGISPGTATIRAMSEQDRNVFLECEVIVKEGQAPIQRVRYTYDRYSEDFGSEETAHIDTCPNTGNPKILVIPIWFKDSYKYIQTANKDFILTDLDYAFFGERGSTGWHSVSSFYKEESKGKCQLTGTVSPWYEIDKESSYYATDTNAKGKTRLLVKEAVDHYFKEAIHDSIEDYDTNGDGYIDSVVLIYGAPDNKQLKDQALSNLWTYCYWVQEVKDSSKIIPNAFLWASYDFMYDGNRAYSRAGSPYGSGSCSNVTIDTHTYIHETGHLFGLEDYYCYNGMAYPAGAFSMQDYNVGGHDPFSLFSLGWLNPFYPNKSCEITLKPFQDGNHPAILLTPSFNSHASAFDEYLLLEFYTPTGLNKLDVDTQYSSNSPKGINDYGIRLWHVDARLTCTRYQDNGSWVYSTDLKTSPEDYTRTSGTFGIRTAMSNTYYAPEGNYNKYCSPLGDNYYKYNLVELIRKKAPDNELPINIFDSNSLYKTGDVFDISTHQQFKNPGLLNNGKELGYSFRVKSIKTGSNPEAVVEIIEK